MLLTHGDSVDKVADGFKVVAQSGNIIAGIYLILNLSLIMLVKGKNYGRQELEPNGNRVILLFNCQINELFLAIPGVCLHVELS